MAFYHGTSWYYILYIYNCIHISIYPLRKRAHSEDPSRLGHGFSLNIAPCIGRVAKHRPQWPGDDVPRDGHDLTWRRPSHRNHVFRRGQGGWWKGRLVGVSSCFVDSHRGWQLVGSSFTFPAISDPLATPPPPRAFSRHPRPGSIDQIETMTSGG